MAVDPRRITAVSRAAAAVYREAELSLIKLLTRRLRQNLDDEAGTWASRRLAEVTAVRRAADLVSEQVIRRGAAGIRRAVADAYRAGRRAAVVELAEHLTGDVGPRARAANFDRGNAVQALADAIVSDLRPAHEAILPQAVNAYRAAVTRAAARHLAGGIDLRRAAQGAWQDLTDRGITAFTDTAGRRWPLHTWVEMACRTAAHRASVQGLVDEYTAEEHRLVYVPDRPRECELCRPFEARVLALWGEDGVTAEVNERTGARTLIDVIATLDQARAEGLFHPGCRHTLRVFHPGLTTLRPATAPDPEGYEAEQRQRQIERHLRRWRVRQAAALTDDARQQANARVLRWETAMRDHITANPRLTRLLYREQPGAGYVPATSRQSLGGT